MMTWDGTAWLVVIGGSFECLNWSSLIPKTGSTWAVGFRPTKARVTFSGGTAPVQLGFCDAAGNLLGHNLACVSPQEIALDFSLGNDLDVLDTTNLGMTIENVEFFSG
jgi:hypothetical protein